MAGTTGWHGLIRDRVDFWRSELGALRIKIGLRRHMRRRELGALSGSSLLFGESEGDATARRESLV